MTDNKVLSFVEALRTNAEKRTEESSCRALWLAVIYQAMLDLVGDNEETSRVKQWFFTSNSTFGMVCSLAGLNPEDVRHRAHEVQINPKLLGHTHV